MKGMKFMGEKPQLKARLKKMKESILKAIRSDDGSRAAYVFDRASLLDAREREEYLIYIAKHLNRLKDEQASLLRQNRVLQ